MYDWVVVGAGLTGATLAERLATELGQQVLVVERRDHVAGNAHDFYDEHGVLVHKYGPHIFHTNSAEVWQYLSRFTEWRPYEHRVLAEVDGALIQLPVNLRSVSHFAGGDTERAIAALRALFPDAQSVPVLRLRESEDAALRQLGQSIYEKVFLNYTTKQWGVAPDELDPSVTGRVPVRLGFDDRYFTDQFQAMPADGYTALVKRMLAHPRITVHVNTDFRAVREEVGTTQVLYTGAIDEYFDYRLGHLPYRSIDFRTEFVQGESQLPVATVNYPNAAGYTRTTDIRQITGQDADGTVLITEYPLGHIPGENEPLYPVPRATSRDLHAQYARLPRPAGVRFAGRLGDYRYYNMDQAVARALQLFETIRREHAET